MELDKRVAIDKALTGMEKTNSKMAEYIVMLDIICKVLPQPEIPEFDFLKAKTLQIMAAHSKIDNAIEELETLLTLYPLPLP